MSTMAPVDNREVIDCSYCKLRQFQTASLTCRRCKRSTAPPARPAAAVEAPRPFPTAEQLRITGNAHADALALACSQTVARLRRHSGVSQKELARRMGCPRTYFSKVEQIDSYRLLIELARKAARFSTPAETLIKPHVNDPDPFECRLDDHFGGLRG